jgi:uncharacterized protein YfeS
MDKFRFSPETAHPNAKALMEDDFFWSPVDEEAPFGSDAGSDAAYGFQKWRQAQPSGSPIDYLQQFLGPWAFSPLAWDDLDPEKIEAFISIAYQMSDQEKAEQFQALKRQFGSGGDMHGTVTLTDEQLWQIVENSGAQIGLSYLSHIDHAIIGTAFAQFAQEGKVDSKLKYYAKTALQREMLPIVLSKHLCRPPIESDHRLQNQVLGVVDKMPTI